MSCTDLVFEVIVDNPLYVANVQHFSEIFIAKNMPWQLRAEVFSRDTSLDLFVDCLLDTEGVDWGVEATHLEFRVVNRNGEAYMTHTVMGMKQYRADITSIGVRNMKWDEYMEPGFIYDGAYFKVEARITIGRVLGLRTLTRHDFSTAAEGINNVVLVVDKKQLHVSKEVLAVQSPVFARMFFSDFAEKDRKEIDIKEVDYEQFVDFLNLIYQPSTEITAGTVCHILILADRFQTECITRKAEDYLLQTAKFDTVAKLAFSEEFRLERLLIRGLNAFNTTEEGFKIKNSPDYEKLSNDTKVAILDRLMELSGPSTATAAAH